MKETMASLHHLGASNDVESTMEVIVTEMELAFVEHAAASSTDVQDTDIDNFDVARCSF